MRVISIDPGKATGIAMGYYDESHPYQLAEAYLSQDGIEGFREWWIGVDGTEYLDDPDTEFVVEGFVLRQNNFLPSLLGVEIIGFLKGMDQSKKIFWQSRTDKSFSRTNKKAADELLKAHDLWQTGKKFNHKDGRDVNDAIIHALAHMKKIRHEPSVAHYFPGES